MVWVAPLLIAKIEFAMILSAKISQCSRYDLI